jgi:glucose/arabinose dehydrogenase
LTDEVENAGDRGLIGVVAHPNFAQNPYVFLSFTVDPIYGQPDEPENFAAIQRLIRLTDMNGATSDSTRMTLFGATAADTVYICYNTHALGQVRFGLDGSLLLTTGKALHTARTPFNAAQARARTGTYPTTARTTFPLTCSAINSSPIPTRTSVPSEHRPCGAAAASCCVWTR